LKQLYFYKLYQYNRKLFYGIFSFVLITIICNLLGYEATPFFVWGMYSEKEIAPDAYEVQEIIINDSIRLDNTSGYTPSTRFYINSPLWYFIALIALICVVCSVWFVYTEGFIKWSTTPSPFRLVTIRVFPPFRLV